MYWSDENITLSQCTYQTRILQQINVHVEREYYNK
jgi:hypothetical protein